MDNQWSRQVVPRWRSSATSARLAESQPSTVAAKSPAKDALPAETRSYVEEQLAHWKLDPTYGVAADILNFSHIPEIRDLLVEPAKFILVEPTDVSPQLLAIANHIVGNTSYTQYDDENAYYQQEISRLKRHLYINPRNSIALIDMARIYAIQGQNDHAANAIKMACILEPNNRFVLRSAARFYTHHNESDRALAILRKSPRTAEDPWLMASMIAVETLLGKSPVMFKKAQRILEGGRFAPIHLAELGAALGTLHMEDGQAKTAKRTFNIALQAPNDNTVAQAVWFVNHHSMTMNIMPEWLKDRYSSEAQYYDFEKRGDYAAALAAATSWFEDEPFSSRPLRACAHAASIIGKYALAESHMRQALKLVPNEIECKNNLVFTFAAQDKIKEAVELLHDTIQQEMSESGAVSGHTLANLGMYYYRTGHMDRGYSYYQSAYSLFDSKKESASKSLAMAYWVLEATHANDPRLGELLQLSESRVTGEQSLGAQIILNRAKKIDAPVLQEQRSPLRSALKWEHDKLNNVLVVSKALPFNVGSKK